MKKPLCKYRKVLICGYKVYDDSKPPFDSSLMVYFRKRLTAEVLGEINEMILVQAKVTPALESVETPAEKKTDEQSETDDTDDDNKPEPPANSGTMIVDATCAPSQIRFPQDTALLNEARENTEAIIDALHISGSQKPRIYCKRAHKDYLKLVRCRKPSAKKIRKCIGQQLRYLRRNLNATPFNIHSFRTIKIDDSSIYTFVPQIESYQAAVSAQARQLLDENAVDNPITSFMNMDKINDKLLLSDRNSC